MSFDCNEVTLGYQASSHVAAKLTIPLLGPSAGLIRNTTCLSMRHKPSGAEMASLATTSSNEI